VAARLGAASIEISRKLFPRLDRDLSDHFGVKPTVILDRAG